MGWQRNIFTPGVYRFVVNFLQIYACFNGRTARDAHLLNTGRTAEDQYRAVNKPSMSETRRRQFRELVYTPQPASAERKKSTPRTPIARLWDSKQKLIQKLRQTPEGLCTHACAFICVLLQHDEYQLYMQVHNACFQDKKFFRVKQISITKATKTWR